MSKVLNFLFLLLILIFFSITYMYYSSTKNVEAKNFNRNNIDKIINDKISNLPILENDTKNIIEFNDGFTNEMNKDEPRSFWKLLKSK